MPRLARALPLKALGSNLTIGAEHFQRDVQKLDRTEAMFFAAKINLLVSNCAELEETKAMQELVLGLLISDGIIDETSVKRIKSYARDTKTRYFYFSRRSILEAYRWFCLWAKDYSDGASQIRSPLAKVAFIRALIRSFEATSGRLETPRLSRPLSQEQTFFESLPVIRELSLSAPGITNVYSQLGRCRLLMDAHFFDAHPEYLRTFESVTKLTVQEYRDCATLILMISMHRPNELTTLDNLFEFTIANLCERFQISFDALNQFMQLESIKPTELAERFAGSTMDSFLNLKQFRDKAILTTTSGRSIALDLTMLAERAAYGPLFYAIDQGQTKFDNFGRAFEQYVQDECVGRANLLGSLGSPLRNPTGTIVSTKEEREITDIAIAHKEGLIFIEVKGSWLDDLAYTASTAEEFWKKVNTKYSMSDKGRKKGLAQLADAIKALIDGSFTANDDAIRLPLSQHCAFFPVLLAHDYHLSVPMFAHFFATDFAKAFDVDQLPADGFFEYKGHRIYSLVVMSIDEFENLEHFGSRQDIGMHLKEYSNCDKDRLRGFREYIINAQDKVDLETESHAMRVGLEVMSEISARIFGKSLPPPNPRIAN